MAFGADAVTVAVNTGDDFEHLGLHVSPDVDTILYTLSGLANRTQGWGLEGESWAFMDQLRRFEAPDWFLLGDRDLAIHVLRTMRLRAGDSLTGIVADFARKLGVGAKVLPMSDDPVRTMVRTPGGELAFQDYFVRRRCADTVEAIRLAGIEDAAPNPAVLSALADPDLAAVLFCPSNPHLSIGPILAVRGIREGIAAAHVPVVAVSPIVNGQALKGPAAKIMMELELEVSAVGIARHYAGLIDGLLIDDTDRDRAAEIESLGIRTGVTDIVMRSDADRERLARECLSFASGLGGRPR